jgi:alanine dehydrogenase
VRIGVPKEIKNNENRVAITPAGVHALVQGGHRVLVEHGAGAGCGFSDEEYTRAGARMVSQAEAWNEADMVLKVKEPLESEYRFFREGLVLFTYLHLAADPRLARELADKRVVAIAYETVQTDNGALPLLAPMSEIAGRMAPQIGAQFLEKHYGGGGILLGGVPGVPAARVVIVGGGAVGTNAAKIALGLGARVTIFDKNGERLRYLDDLFGGRVETVMSNAYDLAAAVATADLVIGCVLIPGAKAPKLVTEPMVRSMKPGSVIVDVAIDQGGSIETVDHITTHDDPVYIRHGVVHYAVANMPGAVARTATLALTNATLPYVERIARDGWQSAARQHAPIARGVNLAGGRVTHPAVADSVGLPYTHLQEMLAS